ncbi:DUF1836 domain-containing protein [Caloramator sp. CAR-1]|uniref:DUF1836 domain-containing protein n=1 Tax=Caloramator sp. CAR-1 TaxID=3062777 RepID=UPI0026E3DC8B|nr:DUF1836 domain-containing protein [Caloramator sp. CAR-1]MDO6354726.1 DUF1836 domain-containing protein [Caloramator sp. CAR-1]
MSINLSDKLVKLAEDISKKSIIGLDDLPPYDLFLSQVTDFLNNKLNEEYTSNIIQNYIKAEVISKPEDGKKRGYTKDHLIQLILLNYMRPILTTEEIKEVFNLAFNKINEKTDDLITWEFAYEIFVDLQKETLKNFISTSQETEKKLKKIIDNKHLNESDSQKLLMFLTVISLIAQATAYKKLAHSLLEEFEEK